MTVLTSAYPDRTPIPCACGCGEPANGRMLYLMDLHAGGLTYEQVGWLVGTPSETVKTYVSRGRRGDWPKYADGHRHFGVPQPCGTAPQYRRGCRCDDCKEAQALYHRQYRAQRTSTGLAADDPRHGTLNGYTNYGCRCRACQQAQGAYRQSRHGGRRLGSREVRRVRRAFGWTTRKQDRQAAAKEKLNEGGYSASGEVHTALRDQSQLGSDPTFDAATGEDNPRVGTAEWLAYAKCAPIIPADFIRRTIDGEIDLHVEADGEVWFGQPKTHDGPRFLSDVEGAPTPEGLVTSMGKMRGHGKRSNRATSQLMRGRRPSRKAKADR